MGIETSRTTRGARTTREGVAVRAVRARDGFERRGDARKSDDADGRLAQRRATTPSIERRRRLSFHLFHRTMYRL
jgi:hypothetical protein